MATYLITYDLSDASKENDLLAYIKTGSWAKVAESSYAVVRNDTPSQIVDKIKSMTNNAIQVYVFSVSKPYGGYGPVDVNKWLDNNLP